MKSAIPSLISASSELAGRVPVRWWNQATPYGPIVVVLGDRGLRLITLPETSGAVIEPLAETDGPPRPDRRTASALDAWFAGRRTVLDLAVDLDDQSPFRRDVLVTLAREVHWGETVTYGELAALVGNPGAARAVGSALRRNPVPFVVPCHRVVAADGIGGYGGRRDAVGLKRALLDRERASTPH